MAQQPNIGSFLLGPLLHDLLRGNSDVPISQETAEVIHLHFKNKHTVYVQFPSDTACDLSGKLITQPRLWTMTAWLFATERWQSQRAYSDKLMRERQLFRANVNLVARKISKSGLFTDDQCQSIAYDYVKNNRTNRMKHFGVKKLYTSWDEIP